MSDPEQVREQRVLVLAPTRRDAQLVTTLLEEDGIDCTTCSDIASMCAELEHGAAAIVLAEEAVVDPSIAPLTQFLARQPAWSDFPVLVLTRHGADSEEVVRSLATLGNVTLLERPTRVAALVSAVRSALRARARQYQLRAQLVARERADRRRETELAVANALALAEGAHEALQGILRSVCEQQGWEFGAVWEVAPDGRMVCSETCCASKDAYTELEMASHALRFERGAGLPGRVWSTGAPVYIADVMRDANFPRGPFAVMRGLRSAIALPIRYEEEVIGAMEFLSRHIGEPDPELLAMMSAIGANIGQVLETRRAQENLRRSESNLSDFFENATVGLHWVGPDGIILRANRAELALLGYSAEEYIGHPIQEFHADPEVIQDILLRLTRGEVLGDYQARMRCKDGSIKVVVISSSVLHEDGRFVHTRCFTRDITARVHAESALHASEERVRQRAQELETLMDAVPAVVFVAHDVACKRITGNRAAYELLRSRPGANLSMEASEFERPTHFKFLRSGVELQPDAMPMQKAARGVSVRSEEIEVVFEDGTRRHLYGSAIPLQGDDGEPRGAIGSFIDITDRKRIEVALRQSERVYRGIGESIEYGVWVCDADGRNVYVSDSFLRLTGMTQSECAGFAWLERVHEDDRADAMRSWQECVESKQPWYCEHRILGVDGAYHPILARGTPVYDERGELVCWAGINLDIARLKEAQESLRVADRRKDEFLATLAHELRNPLAPIRTSVQLLRGLDIAQSDFLWSREVIDRQTQQLTRLVDDLLDVSRITRGKVELRREHLVLGDVVRSVLDATRALVQAAGHDLRVVQPDQPVPLFADPVRLSQCLSNLLHNAVKYTPPGGHIELRVERDRDEVVIRVRDDGIGIAASELGHIFEMFTQAETALDRAQGGLGIGLSIVKTFVEMHGGTVVAKSDGPGRGSEFVVRMPIDVPKTSVRAGAPAANGIERNGKALHRVLVVDDNKDSAESLSIFLRRSGHEVHTAYDGQQAIDALAQFHPQVVVLDIGLPGLSGFEVARRMRSQPGGNALLLIAATGWGQAEHLSRSREAGFDHHMVKPIDVLALQQLLSRS